MNFQEGFKRIFVVIAFIVAIFTGYFGWLIGESQTKAIIGANEAPSSAVEVPGIGYVMPGDGRSLWETKQELEAVLEAGETPAFGFGPGELTIEQKRAVAKMRARRELARRKAAAQQPGRDNGIGITKDDARRELLRRELARRQSSSQVEVDESSHAETPTSDEPRMLLFLGGQWLKLWSYSGASASWPDSCSADSLSAMRGMSAQMNIAENSACGKALGSTTQSEFRRQANLTLACSIGGAVAGALLGFLGVVGVGRVFIWVVTGFQKAS